MLIASNNQTKKREHEDAIFLDDVLKHYKLYGRHDLIWRKKISAYRILVSEVMLQQTQVNRVLPKFTLWMKQYPTLSALKKSNLRDVLVLWQGLGYQRRAKALLQIAQTLNVLPKKYNELLLLPGIGPYTASALCAFAYNIFAHPVLETNIRTVLIEYFHHVETNIHDGVLYDDLSRLEKNKRVRTLGAREWYYALMDFGAHLKSLKVRHNAKSAHHTLQSVYKGSFRELRAKTLFAITCAGTLPNDNRLEQVLLQLTKEGFIIYNKNRYHLKDV
jgi:A/G-specific adenine glycosylase